MSSYVIEETHGSIKKIEYYWETVDSTAVIDATATVEIETDFGYNGEILELITEPGSGLYAPDDNYDVVMLDEDLHDVLCGAGADRSSTVTEYVQPTSLGVVANDKLKLQVSNHGGDVGDVRNGTVTVFIR